MEELDLKELVQIFWEKKIQIILITAIFIALGIIYSLAFVVPKYESTTTLLLSTNSPASSDVGGSGITTTEVTLNSNLVSTYSDLVTSSKVIRNVISNLAINADEESIKKNVSVSSKTGTSIIEIKVKNEDPVLSAKITNEIAKVFIENIKELYDGMQNLHVVDEAEIEDVPVNVNHVRDTLIFAAIGIVVSSIYVLVSNMLDTTIKSAEDIEKVSGVTVLATIPIYESVEDKAKTNKRKGVKR